MRRLLIGLAALALGACSPEAYSAVLHFHHDASSLQAPWPALAQCESGGRWDLDSRFDGGLQWMPSTWRAYRDADDPRYAWQATPRQQVEAGERLVAAERRAGRGGYGPWPTCARRLGLPR